MSILFVIENANLHGGTEIQSFNLLHALRAVGEDVWLLSLVPYEGEKKISCHQISPQLFFRRSNIYWLLLRYELKSILRRLVTKRCCKLTLFD